MEGVDEGKRKWGGKHEGTEWLRGEKQRRRVRKKIS